MKKIVVDNSLFQTRIALVNNCEPVEFFYESRKEKSLVGNIYAGRVENILNGMQACFVDIGFEKNGYLPINPTSSGGILKNGDTVIVQVEKDAFGSKGVVLTQKISFAGKFLVLISEDNGSVGISRKITEDSERDRIYSIAKRLLPDNCSIIVRTEGEGRSEEECVSELDLLSQRAAYVNEKAGYRKAPALIFEEEDFVIKVLKNIFTSDIDEVIVNSAEDFDRICRANSLDTGKVTLYDEKIPVFESFYIESKIDKLFCNKIWLKSGGFIIIEQTEACVVIDVNTGKYTGKKNIQETFLKTNLEAADEIASQIRLRNLSGMIIIDFIDMKDEKSRQQLTKRLQAAVKNDRMKTTVVGMTELGLMQLTRKKSSLPVISLISGECMACKGRGITPSCEYTSGKILREIISVFSSTMFSKITVCSNKKVLGFLKNDGLPYIEEIERNFKRRVVLKEIETAALDYYELKKEMSGNEGAL